MFDFVKRLFGEGTIYCTFECSDGTTGRSKCPYIGDPATMDRSGFMENLKNEIFYKYGKTVTKVTDIKIS